MVADKSQTLAEPSLEAVHTTTTSYFRQMGKRITQMRRARGMSQAELARVVGLSQQSIFSIELGERRLRLDLVPALTRTFRVTSDELLGLAPMPPLKECSIPDRQLRHLETLKQLSEGDQRFILKLAEEMASR
jgi:transcriptional regulator with XRE-family HTH domain